MSLKAKVKNAVDIAFNKLKDLSYEVVLYNKDVEGFNFSTGETISSGSTHSTFGFLETKTTMNEGVLVTKTTLTIKSTPEVEYSRYTEVEVDGSTYRCSILSQDEFVTILSLTRA
jgi:hypothetical protein